MLMFDVWIAGLFDFICLMFVSGSSQLAFAGRQSFNFFFNVKKAAIRLNTNKKLCMLDVTASLAYELRD